MPKQLTFCGCEHKKSKESRQNSNLDAVDNAATIIQTCKVSKSSDHGIPFQRAKQRSPKPQYLSNAAAKVNKRFPI
jgi:hypothetical protein